MKSNFDIIRSELERIANNCEFYKAHGMTEHYKNEVGCLRGMMYAADAIKCPYPQYVLYHMYIKPEYNRMEEVEPLQKLLRT